jgi:5-methylcytosine-specific restriction endonuclease McrA
MNSPQRVSHLKVLFPTIPILQSKPVNEVRKKGKPAKQPPPQKPKKYKKKPIPSALREASWILKCGKVFEHKCNVEWCPNVINAFDFQAGHNIPESKGGPTNIDNLIPICGRCNNSMGDRYTIDEWNSILGYQKKDFFPNPLPLQKSHGERNLVEPNSQVEKAAPVKKGFSRYFCCCFG